MPSPFGSPHPTRAHRKQFVSFFQVATALATTYRMKVPDLFHQIMSLCDWIRLDWDRLIIPAQCVAPGNPAPFRIALASLIPLGLIMLIILFTLGKQYYIYHCRRARPKDPSDASPSMSASAPAPILEGAGEHGSVTYLTMLQVLPGILLLTFIFLPSVSQSILKAWDCRAFADDTAAARCVPLDCIHVPLTSSTPPHRKSARRSCVPTNAVCPL